MSAIPSMYNSQHRTSQRVVVLLPFCMNVQYRGIILMRCELCVAEIPLNFQTRWNVCVMYFTHITYSNSIQSNLFTFSVWFTIIECVFASWTSMRKHDLVIIIFDCFVLLMWMCYFVFFFWFICVLLWMCRIDNGDWFKWLSQWHEPTTNAFD